VRWVDGGDMDAYYHPFTLPVGLRKSVISLPTGWRSAGPKFRGQHVFSAAVCSGLGAQADHDTRIHRLANYAYHLDAGKFAPFSPSTCRQARRQARG